ncbi:MAG: hypothetical protein RR144_02665 [Clostridia bacterium]
MVYNEYIERDIIENINDKSNFIKKKINLKIVVFIILTVILSMQSFSGGLNPFGFVMIGLASVFNVPLLLVFICSLIGMMIASFSINSIISLTLFFVIFTLFTVLINIEGISSKYITLIKLVISCSIVKIINLIFLKDLTAIFSIYEILLVAILYIVFLSGIFVIVNCRKGYIFSEEENIAMLCIIAFLISSLNGINIYGISIMNVIGIMTVMIYGWKNGPILGSASGLIMGLVISAVGQVNPLYIVSLAFSSMIAGLLGKIGRIAVAIGFVLGCIVVNYLSGSFSYFSTTFIEVLIASIPLIFMPKRVQKGLDNFFNINGTLKPSYENLLDYGSDVKNRLNAVSGVFNSLSEVTFIETKEDKDETREVIKKYIEDYVSNNCIDCQNRHECVNKDTLEMSVDYISSKLENSEEINDSMLNIQCNESNNLIKNIKEIYNSMKVMRIIKRKEIENTKKLSKQYKEVSKIISDIAKNIKGVPAKFEKNIKKLREELKLQGFVIYEDDLIVDKNYIEYTFITDILMDIDKQKKEIIAAVSNILEKQMVVKLLLNISKTEKSKIKLVSMSKYGVQTSIAKESKTNETVSGDSYLCMDLETSKYMSAISDGAGSGIQAEKSSKTVINMLEKLLNGGFSESKAIEIVNSIIKMKEDENNFASLDIIIMDLEKAEAEYIKLRSCSYIYFTKW